MVFDVEVAGTMDRTARLLLADVVGADGITAGDGSVTVRARDQAALVAVVTRLNDMGVPIRDVHARAPRLP